MKNIFLVITTTLSTLLYAQEKPILVRNVTAHLGNGKVIENAVVGFENGKFTLVADATLIKMSLANYSTIIDGEGKHLYPGFITLSSGLGLIEIDAVRATNDLYEVGDFNPHVRSAIAFNTDSEVLGTVCSNGVLMAEITPNGEGYLTGRSSLMKLQAWTYEDAAIAFDIAQHLYWPERYSRSGWWAEPGEIKKNEDYDNELAKIELFFEQSKAHCSKKNNEPNIKFDAMQQLWEGKQVLIIHTNNAASIIEAVNFAKKHELKPIIAGAADAHLILDFLSENKVSIILGRTQALPNRKDEAIDIKFTLPALLHKAGIVFAFSSIGADSWQERNIPFQAGQCLPYGLDYEAAVQALSLNACKILQVDTNIGSIETGKDATFILSDGDALDELGNKIIEAYIRGEKIDLGNKQKELYEKYKEKYKLIED